MMNANFFSVFSLDRTCCLFLLCAATGPNSEQTETESKNFRLFGTARK